MSLYVWNARISAAILETLHHVEVLLRNTIDAQFPPVNASEAPGSTWLEDPAVLTDASRKRVRETIARLAREGKRPTHGGVVAGLSFGFWRALFDKKYHRLWGSHLHRAFPAGSGDRAEIAALTSNLVPLRTGRLGHLDDRHLPAGVGGGRLDDGEPPAHQRASPSSPSTRAGFSAGLAGSRRFVAAAVSIGTSIRRG